ncbi:41823_t:CDS:2, partial [Gigaspora margarita]
VERKVNTGHEKNLIKLEINQFEYDEWCKIRRFLNTAIVNKDWVLIGKIQNVAATRAFMIRVAKKEGWNVATNIRDSFDKDPIEAFFQEKLLTLVSSFSNSPGEQVLISIGTKIREAPKVNLGISR